VSQAPAPKKVEGIRFRADGLKSHRARLGLSAADYGRLVGASGLSVYHWESGKARPRKEQVAKLASVRGIGKREAVRRLELLDGTKRR
jgi:predicted transcriptional regulator